MIVCVPVQPDGTVDPRWGRARRIAVAEVRDGEIARWDEVEVGWDHLHDEGSSARHHARVARFLREQGVEAVVAAHVGDGMVRMLGTMHLALHVGAAGDARAAVTAALA